MKSKFLVLSLAMASYASAVDIYITGATAFRTAAVRSICAAYASQGAFTGNYNSGSLTGASLSTFSGTFPGIAGTTTIHCAWNGSVEGIKAISLPEAVQFLTAAPAAAATASGTGGAVASSLGTSGVIPQLAFSDVSQASTPFTAATLYPEAPQMGVVAFSFVVNHGGDAGVTAVNSQLATSMLEGGSRPLRMFTGLSADATKRVYLTGRNDGSGTRTTVFAETGHGITSLTQQWKPTVVNGALTVANNITTLRLWPTGDAANASLIWGPDTAGNGGFSSGGNLTASMRATSNSVQLQSAAGVNSGAPGALTLIGYQSASDAFNTQGANSSTNLGLPGRLLAYNGAGPLAYTGSVLSTAAVNQIATGQYTLWGYEVLYSNVDLGSDANVNSVWTAIQDGMTSANLGLSGVPLASMFVSRSEDGGTVAP
jgi:hypothetical protein